MKLALALALLLTSSPSLNAQPALYKGADGGWRLRTEQPAAGSIGAVTQGTSSDGGTPWQVLNAPTVCSQGIHNTYLMDGGSITAGSASSRLYSVICNSRDNTSGNIRCRGDSDGGVVSVTAGTTGDVLGAGDCVTYTNPVAVPIRCIGSGTYLTSYECVP